jgi:hypothetical protein
MLKGYSGFAIAQQGLGVPRRLLYEKLIQIGMTYSFEATVRRSE